MSRSSLLNTIANVYRKQYANINGFKELTLVLVSENAPTRCTFRSGGEPVINGKLTSTVDSRFYFNPDIDIKNKDIIEWNNERYEVVFVNPLSKQTGIVEGLQVDSSLIRE